MVSFDHYIAALEQRVTNGGFIYRAGVAVAFDYKKGYKEYYLPPKKPGVVEVPEMAFLAVRGHGDSNEEGGAYKDALEMLYGVAYTIKMSKKGDHRIEGYFDFVVPPLEGFWWQDGVLGVDYARKEDFNWISAIRVPDFVTRSEFEWAVEEATAKKKRDFSQVELLTIEEGLCVQCLHVGPYDDEPATVEAMRAFAEESGYVEDFSDERMHHEIYLNDARRTAPEKLKTVIRHPFRRA